MKKRPGRKSLRASFRRRGTKSAPGEPAPQWWRRNGLLDAFAVKNLVEALALVIFVDTNPDRHIDTLQDYRGADPAPKDGDDDTLDLDPHLDKIALQNTGGAADGLDGEHTGQKRADDAADTMDAEAVE